MDLSKVKVGDRLKTTVEYPDTVLPGSIVEVTQYPIPGLTGLDAKPIVGGDYEAQSRSWYYMPYEVTPVKPPRHGGSWYAKSRKSCPPRPTTTPRKPLDGETWKTVSHDETVFASGAPWPGASWDSPREYDDKGKSIIGYHDLDLVRLVKYADGTPVEPEETCKKVQPDTTTWYYKLELDTGSIYWCDGDTVFLYNEFDEPYVSCITVEEFNAPITAQGVGNLVPLVGGEVCEVSEDEPTYFMWEPWGDNDGMYWCDGDTVRSLRWPGGISHYSKTKLLADVEAGRMVELVGGAKVLGEYWGTVTPGYVPPSDTVEYISRNTIERLVQEAGGTVVWSNGGDK